MGVVVDGWYDVFVGLVVELFVMFFELVVDYVCLVLGLVG